MSKKDLEKEVLEKAKSLAVNWCESFRLDGKHNLEECYKALEGRTGPNGEPVHVEVFLSPEEAVEYLSTIPNVKDLQPWSCMWNYYYAAFYECAATAAGINHYLTNQSLLPAFKAGVGYIINFGSLIVAVCLPEAYRDEQFRIHREDGPAIVWGTEEQYWWRGVQVEKEWIMEPGSVDPSLALTHSNVEKRRALSEILGWEKVLDQLTVKVVNEGDSPEIGTLLEVDLPDSPGSKFLRVRCGTGRNFVLPVPESMRTALEANCWTYDLTEEEFLAMEART